MAKTVLNDAFVQINGVNLSDHASKVTVEDMRDTVDVTSFGATNKTVTKGLGDGKITIDFFQDFAGGSVHATLQPLIGSSTTFTVEVRATSGARSATNPGIVMTALLFNYSGLDGSVGEASTTTAEFVNASQSGITYPTA